jgi:ribonuclease HII
MKNNMTSLLPYLMPNTIEAGCDEAGRGCLAGPVVAAAVVLPSDYSHPLLNDSKKLSHKQRETLRINIEHDALAWAVGMVDNEEIDKINILNASFLAMHRALDQLGQRPQHIIVDGNRFKNYGTIPHVCVVKGDGKYLSIAAASILAKTYRDEWMAAAHQEHPAYNWAKNKGYPTTDHRQAIRLYGITHLHRKSFRLLNDQLSLF